MAELTKQFHYYFESFEACKQLLIEYRQEAVVIPLQPLFIQDYPYILPLSYFLNDVIDNEYLEFKLQEELLNQLKSYAPKQISVTALQSICYDIGQAMQYLNEPMNAMDWIQIAIDKTKRSTAYKSIVKARQNRLKLAGEWINFHCSVLIIFGYDEQKTHIINFLLSTIDQSIKVIWALPATETKVLTNNGFSDWANGYQSVRIEKTVQAYDSIADECQMVGDMVGNHMGKGLSVAIVIPNKEYELELKQVAESLKLDLIFDEVGCIGDTLIGQFWKLIRKWVMDQSLDAFIQLLTHPYFQAKYLELLTKIDQNRDTVWIHQKGRVSTKDIYELVHNSGVDDPCLSKIIALKKSNQDLTPWLELLELVASSFQLQETKYYDYLCSEHIRRIILLCSKKPVDILSWLEFMLRRCPAPKLTQLDQEVCCIQPEHVFKYPNHALIVCGVGYKEWSLMGRSQQYLMVDDLTEQNLDQSLRLNLCHWIMGLPNVVSLSMVNQYDSSLNAMPAHIQSLNIVKKHSSKPLSQPIFRRKSLEMQGLIKPKTTTSPSAIESYQQCPYAYYLKHILKVDVGFTISEYQAFGTIFHKIVEQIADKQLGCLSDVKAELSKRLNPLMATILSSKLQSSEWDIVELINFFHSDDSEAIDTEVSKTVTVDQVTIEGRIDIIRRFMDHIEVIDFKTGSPPTLPEIKKMHYLQLGIYGLMLNTDQVKGSIISKKNTYRTPIDVKESSKSVDWSQYQTELISHLKQLMNAQKNNVFKAEDHFVSQTHHLKACRTCNYYSVCYSKERHQR